MGEWILGFSDPGPALQSSGSGETRLGSSGEVGQKVINRCQVIFRLLFVWWDSPPDPTGRRRVATEG